MATGRFIVLEGIDGAGTTSQLQRLLGWLGERGVRAHGTAEPSAGPVGQLLRSLLHGAWAPFDARAMALLFAADRLDHLEREILPQLRAGALVICDRYVLSSLVYQTAAGAPRALVQQANADVQRPDLTLLIDVPAEVGARRRAGRAGAVEIYDSDATQAAVAAAYRREAQAFREAGEPVVCIDGSASIEAVQAAVQAALIPYLP